MAVDFAAGFIGGFSSVLVGHPFDTIKVRLQTQDARNPRYRGLVHCFAKSLKAEGVAGLYKGISFPLGGMAVVNAVAFGAYGNVLRVMDNPDALESHFIAGGCSGVAQAFITAPLELARTRLQLQGQPGNGSPSSGGAFACVRQILQDGGLRHGLFKGMGITLLRDAPAFAIYFSAYELICRMLAVDSEGRSSVWKLSLAGGLGGAISWLLPYPVDVIKSRMQTDGMFGPRKYRSSLHCATLSYQEEGWRVFTRGLSSALVRSFPTNATVFAVSAQVFRFADYASTYQEQVAQTFVEETKKRLKKGIEYPIPSADIYGSDYHYHAAPRLEFPGAHYLINSLIRNMDTSYHSVLYSMHINFKRPRPHQGPGYLFGHNQIPVEDHADDADSVHPTPFYAEDANFDARTAVKVHVEDAAIADANSPLDDEMDIRGFADSTGWRRESIDEWSKNYRMKDPFSSDRVNRNPLLTIVG